MSLPTGTVTFLFTDIEGSTRRWETNAQAMRTILARHDGIMRQAIADHDGRVFKTIGDAFCAVFQRAEDAILACLDAQRGMAAIEVPQEVGPVRVRMALHTGETDERDGDYFGPAVNRVARLLAIGHGEQVLLSETTQQVARRWLHGGLGLRDMGVHRLKDLADAEHVFQLTHPDLRTDFPPLRSHEALPNNLPRQLSTFVGRERELAELREMLGTTSLLTLTGSGGCGKTRLAIRLAQSVLAEYPGGVWLVELAPLVDPKLIPAAALQALGLREQAGRPIMDTLREHLANKTVLIVLDNCEHLLDGCARFVDEILETGADDKVIATSREPLGVNGEVAFRVPSLALPGNGASAVSCPIGAKDLMQYESVALFVERARSANSRFSFTDQSAPAVARICRRLDGIPLAIELAAARVKVLSVEQIHARLDDRFRLLTGGSRTGLARHQTLRAAIAWSYDMLSEDEKYMLRGLSVFAGGWTLEAASKVCCLPDPAAPQACRILDEFEVLDLLTKLVDKSLVSMDQTDGGGEPRYQLLETVRQFALEQATGANELSDTHERHLMYYLALAEQAEPKLIGPEQAQWLARLEVEKENILAAIEWCRRLPDAAETGLRLAGAVWRFWEIRGHLTTGYTALKELLALAQSGPAPPIDRAPHDFRASIAKATNAGGALAMTMGNHEEARALLECALEMRQTLADRKGTGDTLNSLGLLAYRQGNLAHAKQRWEQSLAIRRELGDTMGIAASLNNIGLADTEQGDYASARANFEEALAVNRRLGNRAWLAANLNNLGDVLIHLGDHASAQKLFSEALSINRELGNRAWQVTNLGGLGLVSLHHGDCAAARKLFDEAMGIGREIGDKLLMAEELDNLARVEQREHNVARAAALHEQSLMIYLEMNSRSGVAKCLEHAGWLAAPRDAAAAARLLGAATALREAIGAPLAPDETAQHDAALAAARAASGEIFDGAWTAAQNLLHTPHGWRSAADEALNWLKTAG